jgi:hypothetical protein
MTKETTNAATKNVPKHALQFHFGECKFGDNGETAKTVPFTMTARTGDPINHWFWGRVVHDMGGMKLAKPRLPVDYCHEDDEVLGYANKFDTGSGDLVVSGAVTPFIAEDRASEIVFKQKAGVPYEASIDFSGGGTVIEYVDNGATVEVNGKEFAGPGVVIRQWMLRGIAICPYGADMNTSTEFKDGEQVVVSIFNHPNKESAQMSATATKPAEAAPETATKQSAATATVEAETQKTEQGTEAAAVAVAVEAPAGATQQTAKPAAEPEKGVEAGDDEVKLSKSKLASFEKAFGPDGLKWCLEGKSFEDCTAEFVTKLREQQKTELTAKDAEIENLTSRLAALDDNRGDKGVSFSAADESSEGKRAKQLSGPMGDNLAKVAASLKFVKPNVLQKTA